MPRPRYRRPPLRFWVWMFVAIVLALRLWSAPSVSGQRRWGDVPPRAGPCEVVRVVQADWLVIRQAQLDADVSLRLVYTRAADPLAHQAEQFTREFLSHGTAVVELDYERLDRQGCYLANIKVAGRSLNEALLSAGLARFVPSSGNLTPLQRRLKEAEAAAREAKTGVWQAARR